MLWEASVLDPLEVSSIEMGDLPLTDHNLRVSASTGCQSQTVKKSFLLLQGELKLSLKACYGCC